MGQTGPPSQNQSPFGSEPGFKGMNPSGMMFNRPPMPGPGIPSSMQTSSQVDRFSGPHMGSGEGPGLPFGPDFTAMFRHPPPSSRFPPPPNFQAPPPDHNLQSNQSTNMPTDGSMNRQSGTGSMNSFPSNSASHGNHSNFPHAPGTERLQGDRVPSQQQMPPHLQMPFSPQNQFMSPFQGGMGYPPMSTNNMKSPLEGLFGKPKFAEEDIPQNMAEIIGTLSKMAIQPPRENVLPPTHIGASSFQGHAEGTPKPDSFYSSQRSSSVPAVNIDIEPKVNEAPPVSTQSQQQPPGTYSLFSGSPWLSSGDSKSLGSSPFSSESSSIRNSPDPNSDAYIMGEGKGQGLDMGLRFGSADERGMKQTEHPQHGPFFQNNVQSIWQAQSPLERLLELQKQQRQTEPH